MRFLVSAGCWRALCGGVVLALWGAQAGCGDDEAASSSGAGGECEPGQALGPDGVCVPVETGCSPGEAELIEPIECKHVGWTACTAGFEPVVGDAEPGCTPVFAEACGPFERPELGTTSCAAVGFSSCPAGFALDGGSCVDVLPSRACTGSTFEVLGELACQPVGDCDAAFPPAGATLFVDDSFSDAELDATHYRTIGDALAVASSGDLVAVESGTYVEGVSGVAGVTVAGRCPDAVTIASASGTVGGFAATGPGTFELGGVTLSGHFRGLVASAGAELAVRDVVLDGNISLGVLATQSSLVTIEDSVVRDTQFGPNEGSGYGVEANAGGRIELRRVSLSGNRQLGAQVVGAASSLLLDRTVLRDTMTTASGDFGVGILVRQGATVQVTTSALVGNSEAGVVALDDGTEVVMTDSIVRDTALGAVGYGRGLDIARGARATVSRSAIVRSHEIAVAAMDRGTVIELDTVSIVDTRTDAGGAFGSGVYAGPGTAVSLADGAVVGSGDEAVLVNGPATTVNLTRSLLARAGESATAFGRGLSAYDAAVVTVTSSAVVGVREAGILASDGASVTLTDALVLDTSANAAGVKGRGVVAIQGGSLLIERAAIAGATEFGIFVDGAGTTLGAADVAVAATLPRPSDQRFGRGVGVQSGAVATIERASIFDNHEAGVFVSGGGSTIDLRESSVRRTLALPSGLGGLGLVAQSGASATVATSALSDNRITGVLAGGPSTSISVTESLILRTTIGGDGVLELAHGATAVDGARMLLGRVVIRDCEGIGAAFAASTGSVEACVLAGNRVGLHVQEAALAEVEGAGGEPPPLQVNVTTSTLFIDNDAKLGADILPLPELLPDAEK